MPTSSKTFVINAPIAASQQDQELLARNRQALVLHQAGQLEQAKAVYDEVLQKQPSNFGALHMRGVIAYQQDMPALAVEFIHQAIAVSASNAQSHGNLGLALQALGRLHEAIESYDKAIALLPTYREATANRQSARNALQALEESDPAICLKSGNRHLVKGDHLSAISKYDQCIALDPSNAIVHANRGFALRRLGRLHDSIQSCDKAIELQPDLAQAHFEKGNALFESWELESAVVCYDKALAVEPANALVLSNKGNALSKLNRIDDAIQAYDQAMGLHPNFAEARSAKAMLLLVQGKYEKGWEQYEWRWKMGAAELMQRHFAQPLWLGSQPIEGKTVLLHSEQGFGDTLQFCRYAEMVARLGARVILEAEKPLIGLLQTLKGPFLCVEKGSSLPAFDFHCPLLSLPLAFKTEADSIPRAQRYLHAHPEKVAHFARRLGPKEKPRVGLAWSGRESHTNDFRRSIKLDQLLTALPPGLQYFSLQKQLRDADKVRLQSQDVVLHFGDELNDFSDTAALCDLMDVVVTVDTSVAHLSGALGRPTWILLPHSPDWRWLLQRDDSPWYPSVRLYRQPKIFDWADVFTRIARDLEMLACTRMPISSAPN